MGDAGPKPTPWSHLGVSVSDSCSVAVLTELLKTWSHVAQHSLALLPPPMLLFGVLFNSQLLSESTSLAQLTLIVQRKLSFTLNEQTTLIMKQSKEKQIPE